MKFVLSFIVLLLMLACKDPVLPKPKTQLSLEYPVADYDTLEIEEPYLFQKNKSALVVKESNHDIRIYYPLQKGAIFISYKPVVNNLDSLLRDAQNFTQKHVIKAESISEQLFVNSKNRVFGMLYEVTGNAASQTQFYLTDSVWNFVVGSVYFEARPNYDSILPAAVYLAKDIKTLMESFRWKK
ncbi:MAG: gliding motility lipoprotein GldD [Flavobacteriales bacterium CG_4_9_14_3_um_filter_40_17]|nr:MAG: gliding motility lipoprotein GldD [Flavobacteriales bacterium CG_4_9_14_3_um_filter_40_17]